MTGNNGQATGRELRFSLVIPVHNEAENIDNLLDEIRDVLSSSGAFEVLLMNDASSDDSLSLMEAWKERNSADWLRILTLDSQSGQSAALMAGIEKTTAPLISTMDGDLQNDPRDLVTMLEMLEDEQLAGVSGIRVARKDTFVRRLSSKIGNGVRNSITGDSVMDSACGIKMFRRSYWLMVPRFNGMHRFMPTLVRYAGGQVKEIEVNHRARTAGTAKYGIGNRAFRGLKDCLAVRWYRSRLLRYRVKEER
ncbi:MAG: glycosyltransferase [Planctomycetota bacterium]|nr:glycosyltransferase [Planctomycetota bacterium]